MKNKIQIIQRLHKYHFSLIYGLINKPAGAKYGSTREDVYQMKAK
jgi:hypothetical protein